MLIKHARFGLYALCLDKSFDNISFVCFSFSSRIYVLVICFLNCIYVCLLIVCSPMLEENKISIYLFLCHPAVLGSRNFAICFLSQLFYSHFDIVKI